MDLLFYDQRTHTTLVCGALALAIALSLLLRGKVRKVHLLFAAFAVDVGLWYLSQSLYGFFQASVWERMRIVLPVLMPVFAVNLFEAMVPYEAGAKRMRLGYGTVILTVPMVLLVLSPYLKFFPVRVAIFAYVFTVIAFGLVQLYQRGRRSRSRAIKRRVGLLVLVGALAALFIVADFVWVIGYVPAYHPPPIGVVFSVVFLFMLSQALRLDRLLDLYEMLGQLLVATAVGFLIGLIFYLLVTVLGQFATMYLNAVMAAIVVLVLYNPLRETVEQQIRRLVLGERRNLERAVVEARAGLAHVLEVEQVGPAVVQALERSRRVTAAALYLRLDDGTGFERNATLGTEKAPARIEIAAARALLDKLDQGPVLLELEDRLLRERRVGRPSHGPGEAVLAAAEILGPLRTGVVLAIRAEAKDLLGLLIVVDDRIRDAFSREDAALLETLATQIGVVVENSRLYTQLKVRDRLAVLGRMAAGLAHEIRNPLGAIKGAAQLLAEPSPGDGGSGPDESSREFLNIILEEVDRLDQVVNSVLDLARQSTEVVPPVDVNGVVRHTLQVMSPEWTDEEFTADVDLDDDLPRCAIAPDQLQQVMMNLLRNAMEAMGGEGRARVRTSTRHRTSETFVEVAVTDSGPGLSPTALKSIFLPFFTTKHDGTGLGLAICQRIVQTAGGRIEVRTQEGEGSTFAVILPAATEPAVATPTGAVLAAIGTTDDEVVVSASGAAGDDAAPSAPGEGTVRRLSRDGA